MLNTSAVATIAIANRLRRHCRSRHAARIIPNQPRFDRASASVIPVAGTLDVRADAHTHLACGGAPKVGDPHMRTTRPRSEAGYVARVMDDLVARARAAISLARPEPFPFASHTRRSW